MGFVATMTTNAFAAAISAMVLLLPMLAQLAGSFLGHCDRAEKSLHDEAI